jgi:hypothetical protein
MHRTARDPRRAHPLEVVGAWLHVWTPPRDVDIPPVPWRKLAIGAAIAAVVLGAAGAVIVPKIDEAKRRSAARDRAALAAAAAAERRRILREQVPRRASGAALRPRRGASATAEIAARTALVAQLERAISADAAARARRGELKGPTGETTCAPVAGWPPASDLRAPRGAFDCFTVTARIRATAVNSAGAIAYPFRAIVDWRSFRYVWCKTNPVPGEQIIPDPRTVIELPRVCRATQPSAAGS